MSTSSYFEGSAHYDVHRSTTHYPPGALLTHRVHGVLNHEGIVLGNFADLQRSCVPAHVCPHLWKTMAKDPMWTFVLHQTHEGVLIAPLGKAMRIDSEQLGEACLPVVLWWRLYLIAEVCAYDTTTWKKYNILKNNCQHFVGRVLLLVAPAAYMHPLLHRHTEAFPQWTSAVSCATHAAAFVGFFMPLWAAVAAIGNLVVSMKGALHTPPPVATVEACAAAQQELGVKVYLFSRMEEEGVSAEARFAAKELWYLDSGDTADNPPRWSLFRRAMAQPR